MRQRTLQGAIDWSYNLLAEGERALFARLAVFIGSLLEAAEVVGGSSGQIELGAPPTSEQLAPLELDVRVGMEALMEKSLLRRVDAQRQQATFYDA